MRYLIPAAAAAMLSACATNTADSGAADAAPDGAVLELDEAAKAPPPAQIAIVSEFTHAETVERLRTAIEARPLTVFAVVDHAEGAANAGLDLAPSTLFIFGNPMGGTPLMQADPRMGLELPLKMLVYEAEGDVLVAHPNIIQLTAEYGIGPDDAPIDRIADTLGQIAAEAALAPEPEMVDTAG